MLCAPYRVAGVQIIIYFIGDMCYVEALGCPIYHT